MRKTVSVLLAPSIHPKDSVRTMYIETPKTTGLDLKLRKSGGLGKNGMRAETPRFFSRW
jgi:hypothetical protein